MGGILRLHGTQNLSGKIYDGSSTIAISPTEGQIVDFEDIVSLMYDEGSGLPSRTIDRLIIGIPNRTIRFDDGVDKQFTINHLDTGCPLPPTGKTSLRSATLDAQWYIELTNDLDANYRWCWDVKDSNAVNAITATGSINNGNNTNWDGLVEP